MRSTVATLPPPWATVGPAPSALTVSGMLETTDALAAARHDTDTLRTQASDPAAQTPELLESLDSALATLTVAIDEELQHTSGQRADDIRAERSAVAAEKAALKVRMSRARDARGR